MHRITYSRVLSGFLVLIFVSSTVLSLGSASIAEKKMAGAPWNGVYDYIIPQERPIVLTQPDGTAFEAYLTGAEIGGKLEYNGYTIMQDSDGFWRYAVPSKAGLMTGEIVGRGEPPEEKGIGRTQSIWLADGNDVREKLFAYLYEHNRAVGQKKYVALLMDFTDCQFIHDKSYFENMLSGIGTYTSGSLREFYLENSFGAFEPVIDVYGVYHSNHTMAYYSYDSGRYVDDMLAEILPQVDPQVNFTAYDNDGDGWVDMVIVIHAGPDAAATGNTSGNIWSHASWAYLPTNDGVYIGPCNTGPDVNASIGVFTHEMGHSIGEEDFYDTTYRSMGTGDWDVMAGGCWYGNPPGSNPMHFNPYSKVHQGWLTPTYISTNQHVSLRPREVARDLVQVNISDTQWFYLEYISTMCMARFDRAALASGVIIWHYDAYGSQTNPERYLMDVEEFDNRDGTQELQLNLNRGEPTDLWADDTTGMSDATNPNTSANAPYTKTGIVFANFSKPGDIITFDVFVNTTADISVDKPVVDELVPLYNTTVNISARVYNNGPAVVSNVNVSFYVSAIPAGNTTIASIPAYSNATATVQAVIPVWGDVELHARVDANITESTYSNNLAQNKIMVYERRGQILIVDDDDGYLCEQAYCGILDNLGYSWNVVKAHASAVLMHAYDAVFWESGALGRMEGQLSRYDISQLVDYLDGGGKVWFSSPRLAGALGSTSSAQPGVNATFLRDYLGAVWERTLQSSGGSADGIDELTAGLTLTLQPFPGRPMYDVFNVGVTDHGIAAGIFRDAETGKLIGTKVNATAPYSFMTVFTGFNAVQISNGTQAVLLTERILNWFGVSTIYLDKKTYMETSAIANITVRDQKANQNPGQAESVTVVIKSTSESAGETVTLTETGANTGIFKGSIAFSEIDAPGVLKVGYGDIINATYLDGTTERWFNACINASDEHVPVIEHAPLTIAFNHTAVNITCFVYDDHGLQTVMLYYKKHSAQVYTAVSMDAYDGYYLAQIPADAVTLEGIDYYITAQDTSGNTASTAVYYIQVLETPPVPEINALPILILLCALSLLIGSFTRCLKFRKTYMRKKPRGSGV